MKVVPLLGHWLSVDLGWVLDLYRALDLALELEVRYM